MQSETFREALARLRAAQGLSLRDLGQRTNFSRQYIWDLERGRREPRPATVKILDEALGAGGVLVAVAAGRVTPLGPVGGACGRPLTTRVWRRGDAEQLAHALVAEPVAADNALRLAHEWLVTEPPQRFELDAGRRIGVGMVEQIEQRIQQIRLIDDHVGGRDSYATVAAELAATADLLREASYTDAVGRRLHSATAELCQIGGWIASDASRYNDARRLYLAGARAGYAAADATGAASNLSSLAYQVANIGEPAEAVLLARTASAAPRTRRRPPVGRCCWSAWRGRRRAPETPTRPGRRSTPSMTRSPSPAPTPSRRGCTGWTATRSTSWPGACGRSYAGRCGRCRGWSVRSDATQKTAPASGRCT